MSSFNNQNALKSYQQNAPFDQLEHRYGRGTWILDKDVENLGLENYRINGRGTTFFDMIKRFNCSKDKAQLRLKNACKEKRDKNGKKFSILFTLDNERTKPQQYYPSCIRAEIIENKRNRPIDTTGVNYSNNASSFSHHPIHNAIEQQMVSSFLTQLSLLPFQSLNIHNIHLWMIIDKSHYEEVTQRPWSEDNKTKIQRERIGVREVVFQFYKRGSIGIGISCSENPFKIETDDDVNNFFVFLGKVQDRLAYTLSDPRERIVPSINNWILKSCDFNKDIEIDHKNIGQLLDLNIQIKYVGKAFRLYVKNLVDKFVLREERAMKVDQTITTFMNEAILSPFHLINTKFDELVNIFEKNSSRIYNKVEELEEKNKSIGNEKE